MDITLTLTSMSDTPSFQVCNVRVLILPQSATEAEPPMAFLWLGSQAAFQEDSALLFSKLVFFPIPDDLPLYTNFEICTSSLCYATADGRGGLGVPEPSFCLYKAVLNKSQ